MLENVLFFAKMLKEFSFLLDKTVICFMFGLIFLKFVPEVTYLPTFLPPASRW